jgi:hypothetical protein
MDQLYEELQRFIAQLRGFNESTAKNWDELQRAWESAGELWRDDETRQTFENQWGELASALRLYRQQHGERYEEFLLRRKWALDAYFGRR